jgi:hypothetical protein
MVEQQAAILNVVESMTLYDTVLVSPFISTLQFIDGWFTSFVGIGSQNEVPFLNVRNRNHGLPYCNQDTRDQMPYGAQIYSLGVEFFAPNVATQFIEELGDPNRYWAEEIHSAIWVSDLPRHASITLRINQDDRLKLNCAMAPSGMGPTGGAMGHGDPAADAVIYNGADLVPGFMKGMTSMGEPVLNNRWPFPVPLDVPRKASLSAVIKFSEYGRQLLQHMVGPNLLRFVGGRGSESVYLNSMFGIRVSLQIKRFVQQRGEYHA